MFRWCLYACRACVFVCVCEREVENKSIFYLYIKAKENDALSALLFMRMNSDL
jgi:hypothetical protein